MGRLNKLVLGLTAATVSLSLSGGVAMAQTGGSHMHQATLTPLNKTGDKGTGTVQLTTNGDGTFTVLLASPEVVSDISIGP